MSSEAELKASAKVGGSVFGGGFDLPLMKEITLKKPVFGLMGVTLSSTFFAFFSLSWAECRPFGLVASHCTKFSSHNPFNCLNCFNFKMFYTANSKSTCS